MTTVQAIDADGHVLDNRDLIIARLPKAMRERESGVNRWSTSEAANRYTVHQASRTLAR